MIEIVDLVWIVAIVFPIIAVVEWATTGRIGINMWWLSPIIGSLIYAAIRKPIIRDSLAAGFIGWFIGTILGIPVGYVSTVQIGTINIQPPSLEMGIVFAMVGGAFSFWGSFISAYFALVGKEKPASTRNRKQ